MKRTLAIAWLFCISSLQLAQAGVVVGGTRLVFKGSAKDASISLENTEKTAYLVQSWIDDETDGNAKAAFLVTPPLFRLAPQSSNLLRVIRTGTLPADRESLFWLNVRSIPAQSAPGGAQNNQLTLSVQSRIKLIYRPPALLEQSVDEAAAGLRWRCAADGLWVENPSAYYMNFASVKLDGVAQKAPGFVAPGASKRYPGRSAACAVSWQVINDYGSAGQVHDNVKAQKGHG